MIITAIITFLIVAYKIRRNRQMKKLSWLLGIWEYSSEDETLTETWIRDKKADYECNRSSSKRNLIIEKQRLFEKKGELILVPMILQENEVQPFSFKKESLSDTHVELTNHILEFPQKITYTLLNDNEMKVEMEGIFMERNHVESFVFTRKSQES